MRHHKWGIYWLVMFAWNMESLGNHATKGRWWWVLVAGIAAAACAVMAYRDLTKVNRTVTITITPDMREWDAAMKRAMATRSKGRS